MSKLMLKMWILLFFLSAQLFATRPDPLISVGAGVSNVLRSHNKSALFQIEYMGSPFWGKKYLFIRPLLSSFVTSQGSFYLCGGVAFDIPLGKYAYVTPSFASGFYVQGGGKDLGYPVENRSAIEFGGTLPNQSRIGVQFYHLSNGSLSRKNPGVEILLLQYSIPIKINK